MNGVTSLTDAPRPGQAHRVVTSEAIAAVEAIMKENRCVTVNEIAAQLDMRHGSAHHIVHDVLQFLLCSINYEVKNIYGFHLTNPCIIHCI